MNRPRETSPAAEALVLAPLCAASGLVPLIVFLRAEPLDPAVAQYWHGPSTDYDFFSYYKATAIGALGALAPLVAFACRSRVPAIARPSAPAMAGVGVYVLLALASAMASPFPSIAWPGFVQRYEGFWVLAAYGSLALTAYAVLATPRRLRAAAWCLLGSALAIAGVGLMQLAGLDPFRTELGRAVTIPGSLHRLIDSVMFSLPVGSIYSTLGHYNYVGSYAALLLPLFLVLAVGRPTGLRIVSRIAVLLLAITYGMCGSRAGLVGGGLALGVLVVMWRDVLWTYRWRLTAAAAAALLLVVIVRPHAFGRAASAARAVVANWRAPMGEAERVRWESLPVRAASITGSRLRLETRRGPLIITNQSGALAVSDETGRTLPVFADPKFQRVTIGDDRFSGIELFHGTLQGQPSVVVRQGPFALRFHLTPDGFQYVSGSGRPLPLSPVAAWGGAGHEDAGSARVYIWSRSLPLIRPAPLVGYGPDTFAAMFPQQDFAGKYLAYGTSEMLVDKPHNLYLQTALATGVPSAVLLIGFFGAYIASSWRTYWRAVRDDDNLLFGLGCFAGIVGYLGAAFFNDSVVSVAPVFWVLLGAGWRTNVVVGANAGNVRGGISGGERQYREGWTRRRSAAT